MRRLQLGFAVAATLALSGCADPYAQQQPTTTETALELAERTREWPAAADTTPPQGAAATGRQAIHDFAEASVNWSWRDLASRQRRLAASSVGQAREHAQVLATTAAHDTEMHRGRITHRGTVEAIERKDGTTNTWIVVTREQPGSENDEAYESVAPAYHVTLATVREIRSGQWVVNAWRPQV